MDKNIINFSVLMSIYYKEKPEYFNRCMHSIWNEQTIKPNEIVLVLDGKLTDDLYKVINYWKDKLGSLFKVIPQNKNLGLGEALNIGLKNCSYELIARMDTDDIATPKRFEKQLEVLKNKDIDICSSWVSEFSIDENIILSYRKVPEKHQEIIEFAKKRNPLNHPAVMYKKAVVLRVGGYKHMLWFEDYYLWVRMILNGARFYNIQEPLVNMRADFNQLSRRSGIRYAKEEAKFLKELKNIQFINEKEYFNNLLLRASIRLAPKFIIKRIYKVFRSL